MSDELWKKCLSRSKPGKYYFYNTISKESTWKLPDHISLCDVEEMAVTDTTKTDNAVEEVVSISSDYNNSKASKNSDRIPSDVFLHSMSLDLQESPEVTESVETVIPVVLSTEVTDIALDSGISEDFESTLISEVAILRDKFEVLQFLEHFPATPQACSAQYKHPLYIVVDTSAILAHLEMVAKYIENPIEGVGYPVFLFPWKVLQELDTLYEHVDSRILECVKKAVEFLQNAITSKHSRVLFQLFDEVGKVQGVKTSSKNHILSCCMDYQHRIKGVGGLLVLFTGDVHLSCNATSSRVHCFHRKTLLCELPALYKFAQWNFSGKNLSKAEQAEVSLKGLFCEYKNVVCGALSAVILKEMKVAYDTLWTAVVMTKPPWTLSDVVNIIDKHWVAVFGLTVDRGLRHTCIDILIHLVNCALKYPTPQKKHIDNFLIQSRVLLTAFSKSDSYDGLVDRSISYLDDLSLDIKVFKQSSQHTPFRAPVPLKLTHPPQTAPMKIVGKVFTSPSEEIRNLAKNMPSASREKLPWLLDIVGKTVKLSVTRVQKTASRDVASDLSDMLENIISSIRYLIENELSISSLRAFMVAIDSFLQTHLKIKCPVNLDSLYLIVSQHRQMHILSAALRDYTISCKHLRHQLI